MKNILLRILYVLMTIVLIGKISNWFFNYSDEINQILNTVMFTGIGIAYFFAGFAWDNKMIKIIFMVSGIFLVVMNFIDKSDLISIIGLICILTPLLIARFSPDEDDEKELAES